MIRPSTYYCAMRKDSRVIVARGNARNMRRLVKAAGGLLCVGIGSGPVGSVFGRPQFGMATAAYLAAKGGAE